MKNRITKTLVLLLAVTMMMSCFALAAKAEIKEQNAVGTIVYLKYCENAPNMEEGVIDDTWGEKLIHLTKNTPNAGIYKNTWDYDNPSPEENTYVDIWGQFDDKYMYFAFFTNDLTPLGGQGGDSVCFMFEANNKDLTYICPQDIDRLDFYHFHTVGAHLSLDDYTPEDYGENDERQLTWVEKDGGFYIKYNVPFTRVELNHRDIEEGVVVNFNFLRNILADDTHFASGDGNLYWGKWFTQALGNPPLYVQDSAKAKTTNSFIIKKTNSEQGVFDKLLTVEEYNEMMGIEEPIPEVPATSAEKPSSWAEAEVTKAIDAGLVPAELQKNYTKGISRADLSKILSALIDKVYNKAPAAADAKFGDTTDADVLKAANLGIINGYKQADGSYLFKPQNTLKRSEMSAIINRVAKLCGVTTTGFESEVKFADTASHWCNAELGWPVHTGIVKGTSATAFSPENTLTVEQTIMMVYRTFEALK